MRDREKIEIRIFLFNFALEADFPAAPLADSNCTAPGW